MKKTIIGFFVLVFALVSVFAQTEYTFIVTDVEGIEELQREFGPFKQLLEEKAGIKMKFFPVTSRTAAAEAIKNKKADFVLTGPAEYVVMRTLTNCYPVLGFSRPDYHSVIVVKAGSGINTIADLKGKKIAMSDIGSTSGHLGPSQILKDNGLDPLKDVTIVHTTKEIAWESLKKGDVQAWGYAGLSYASFRDKDKSINPGGFKIIARGPDLPMDVLVAAPHTDKKIVDLVVKTIAANSNELVATILKGEDNQKYKGMQFITNINDSDYNYIREIYKTIGQPRFAAFIGN